VRFWRTVTAREWLLLAVIVAVAFFLRARDIGAFRLSPDDGNYLWSARAQSIERGFDLSRWIAEDTAWVKELAGDSAQYDLYPHSYLHQWVTRCLYRLGLDSVDALRMNSAIFGALSSLALFALIAGLLPTHRRQALFAAALVAVLPVHVWYSRTGWGVIGCTFFLLVYSALAWKLLAHTRDDDRAGAVKLGIGMTIASILAWGYHEMIAPFVVCTGLCFLFAHKLVDRPGGVAAALRSRATWVYVASAVPVGLFTIGVYFFSDFAQEHWFRPDATPYWQLRRESIEFLFVKQRMDRLLTWPVVAAAAFGAAAVWREARGFVSYLALQNVGASALLFFLYQDPFLVRIYLPLVILVTWLAAEGLVSVGSDLSARGLKRFAVVLPFAVLVHLALMSWISLFGPLDQPMFNRYLYMADPGVLLEPRHVDEHMTAYVKEHMKPGERVWTYGDKSPIFRLLDAGLASREFAFEGEPATWPEWIFAPVTMMDGNRRTVESGGEYVYVDRDRAGRVGLYRKR
jgi:hypothetical protein